MRVKARFPVGCAGPAHCAPLA